MASGSYHTCKMNMNSCFLIHLNLIPIKVSLALLIMPSLGWRYLLGISSLPVFISAVSLFWLPESPRYYLSTGNTKMASQIIRNAAKENKNELENFELDETQVELSHYSIIIFLLLYKYSLIVPVQNLVKE